MTPFTNNLKELGIDFRLLFISDHKTLTSTRGHDADPVPYLLYDSTDENNNEPVFSEKAAAKGPYIEKGIYLMDRLFEK